MLLPPGRASIGTVADSLGMTVRTLQRRLDDERAQFSDLLDRVRVREVSRYLAQRRLRLTDIADCSAIPPYPPSATGTADDLANRRAMPGAAADN